MERALLVSLSADEANFQGIGRFKFRQTQRRPVSGLLYIASAIESSGYSCDVIDESTLPLSARQLSLRVKENQYDFVGFYSLSLTKDKLVEYIKAIKSLCSQVKVIVGGPGHICQEELLFAGADLVFRQESEISVCEFIEYLRGERAIEQIDGVSYLKAGGIVSNRQGGRIRDLDAIRFPAWGKIKLKDYYDYSILPIRHPFAPMVVSRGCPFRCSFCLSPYLWGGDLRIRSVDNVLEEIGVLVNGHGVRYIIFQDDAFGADNQWVRDFCLRLIEKKYKGLRWMCILHPMALKDDPGQLIALMKKAGCNLFVFGLQSADADILRAINRDPREPEALKELIGIAKKNDIMTSVDFIFGLPGETEESIEKNIRFCLDAKPYLVNFHTLTLETGSELERDYRNKPVCGLGQERIRQLCRSGNRRFYLKPQNFIRILFYVLRNNPLHIYRAANLCSMLKEMLLC